MDEQPTLSQSEWAIVIELLENERRELPVEIHHTWNAGLREQLHHRAEMVESLLQRLRSPAAV